MIRKFLFIFLVIYNVVNAAVSELSLFKKYETLQSKLPYIKFCDLPTPIVKLEKLGNSIGCKNLFMKADYLTGKKESDGSHLYGGNKPRKLEFLLADARNKGKETIITYGCAGSQHALATAVYAKEMGFKRCILMLKDQPNSPIVRHNLLLDYYIGAELRFFPNNKERSLATEEILKNDQEAYLIPTGGSNEIGAIGFVNAVFELAEQIKQGLIKEPDFIYIPIGSCATTTGLLLGIQSIGLKSKVVAVAVEPEEVEDEFYLKTKELFDKSNKYLNSLDESFKIESFPEDKLIVNKKFAGIQYGLVTKEASDAMRLVNKIEEVKLEGTYSSKPIAAIMDDIANGVIKDETVLFWNTFCGIDYSCLTKSVDYRKLPVEFHKYFEEDVQPLSKY